MKRWYWRIMGPILPVAFVWTLVDHARAGDTLYFGYYMAMGGFVLGVASTVAYVAWLRRQKNSKGRDPRC